VAEATSALEWYLSFFSLSPTDYLSKDFLFAGLEKGWT